MSSSGNGPNASESNTDKFNVNVSLSRNWGYLKQRYLGTGDPDTTRFEWATNMHRDTLASHLGHSDQLFFISMASNESLARTKLDLLDRMRKPIPTSSVVAGTRRPVKTTKRTAAEAQLKDGESRSSTKQAKTSS